MEPSPQQIALLLVFAFKSGLTAEKLIERMSQPNRIFEKTTITLRQLFTRANIVDITGCSHALVTRILNSLFEETRLGYVHWASSLWDLPIYEALAHPDFLKVEKWGRCGKKTLELIYQMFDSVGIDMR